MIIYVIEGFVAAVWVLVVITQLVVPLLTGKPVFPIFTWRSRSKAMAEVEEDLDALEIDEQIDQLVEEFNRKLEERKRRKEWIDTEANRQD